MRLSTKTRYGVRLMIELGLNYQKGYVQLNEIAAKQSVSEKYAEQIISSLKSAGLVQSQRGAQGGYRLARTASSITLREIVENLEGTLELSDHTKGEKVSTSGVHFVWKRLSDSIAKTLDGINLEEVVEESRKKSGAIVYEI
jgi:Rrf2 family protein